MKRPSMAMVHDASAAPSTPPSPFSLKLLPSPVNGEQYTQQIALLLENIQLNTQKAAFLQAEARRHDAAIRGTWMEIHVHETLNRLQSVNVAAQAVKLAPPEQQAEAVALFAQVSENLRQDFMKLPSFIPEVTPQFEHHSLNELIHRSEERLRDPLRQKRLSLHLALAPDLPQVRVDPFIIGQAFDSLLAYLIEALPQGDEFTLETAPGASPNSQGKPVIAMTYRVPSGHVDPELFHTNQAFRTYKQAVQGEKVDETHARFSLISRFICRKHDGTLTFTPGEQQDTITIELPVHHETVDEGIDQWLTE